MYLLFFGPPGSGKSTQGSLLAAKLAIPHISIGDLLRAECQSGAPRAQSLAAQMKQGGMVDDRVVMDLLREHLAAQNCSGGFILDGFPRSQRQLPLLEQLFRELSIDDYKVIDIDLPRAESYQRLMARGRGDDTSEVIERRLDDYGALSDPVLRYFDERKILLVVEGTGTVEEVAARLERALHIHQS